MKAENLADLPPPIVRQAVGRFKRDIDARNLAVLCDQKRLGSAKVLGAFGPDFANSCHFHGDHLDRYFNRLKENVNNCVHIMSHAQLAAGFLVLDINSWPGIAFLHEERPER